MRIKISLLLFLGMMSSSFAAGCGASQAGTPALTLSPSTVQRQWIDEAQAAYAAGDFEQSLALAQQAVAAEPGDATSWEWVRRAIISRSGEQYLRQLPEDRYRVPPEEFLNAQVNGENYFLVDVREPDEFNQGHIQGAINIPLRELMAHLDQLPRGFSTPIMLYCHSQKRSTHALVVLRQVGYTQVFHLEGGYEAYQEYIANHPLPTPGPTPTMDPSKDPERDGGC